jgi:hypothetical protein
MVYLSSGEDRSMPGLKGALMHYRVICHVVQRREIELDAPSVEEYRAQHPEVISYHLWLSELFDVAKARVMTLYPTADVIEPQHLILETGDSINFSALAER